MASIFDRIKTKVEQTAEAKMPSSVRAYAPLAKALIGGNFEGALNAGLDMILPRNAVSEGNAGPSFQGPFLIGAAPLLGGITLKRAREIFNESTSVNLAKKNLWTIYITDLFGGADGVNFNLIATDVSYQPITIDGEAVKVGSGSFDKVNNSERVEMRVTTMDDVFGTVKSWFKERHYRMVNADGTFGVPADYLLRIEVRHAFIEGAEGEGDAYVDTFVMRPGSIEYELSRREDGLQELQMNFVQFDTFTIIK